MKRDSFYRGVAKAMKMDEATVDMLSGEFAVDAILARAEQLALREVCVCVCVCAWFIDSHFIMQICRLVMSVRSKHPFTNCKGN